MGSDPESAVGSEQELTEILCSIQAAVLRHPGAAQELYAWLISEGKRFAETAEGAAWRRRFAGTPLAEHGRAFIEIATLDMLEPELPSGTSLPSRFLDALALLIREKGLQAILGRIASQAGQ